MANDKVFQKYVKGHMTFNLLTPKSIGVFLSLSSICVWSMKFVGWEIFELSHYNKVWTDRQTDGQSDYYRAPASSMDPANLLTPKSIGIFLSLSCICVWSMKFVGWEIFELSHYNKVWTDRQIDGQTDR